MKKLFTLTLLAVLVSLGANAQELRKTWDFRNGFSQKTINALKADQEEFGNDKYWRNFESDANKADSKHFWNASADFKNADKMACTHNGGMEKVIEELEGLRFTSKTAAKKVVITYDESQAENADSPNGMYPFGKSHLWINGKDETIVFQANCGQQIRIGIESHKNTEARGISLSTSTGSLTLESGVAVPKFFNECVWTLSGDESEVANLTIKSTNGCHIYYIIVGEGDDPNANKTKVTYLTEGNDGTSEAAYQALVANDQLNVTITDLTEKIARGPEYYSQFDAIVVGTSVNNGAGEVKDLIAFYPILNLNAKLYDTWGYGLATNFSQGIAKINNLRSDLFMGFEENTDYFTEGEGEETINFFSISENAFTGVKLGDFFAGDNLLATDFEDETVVAIHTHNLYHNTYIFIPAEAATSAPKLLVNAIDVLKSSKSKITKTPTPKINFEYKDLNTNITMAMASSNLPKPHIYYTLDGSEPTENSTEFTEAINITSPCTVKAVAIAEGYLLSDVATAKAEIFSQPETPTISVTQSNGFSTVTLDCATAGVYLYYNYDESNDSTKSTKYTAPITLMTNKTLTAFAVINNVLSETATQQITVKEPVVFTEVLSHMDANKAEYYQKPIDDGKISVSDSKVAYYFSWGKTKTAYAYYNESAEPIEKKIDPETGDEINIYPKNPEEKIDFENGWAARSRGQIVCDEITISAGTSVAGDGARDGKGISSAYNPATVDEFEFQDQYPVTNYYINISEWNTEKYPRSGMIYSTQKFKGPFAILSYISNGNSGKGPLVVFETGTDIEGDAVETEWKQVGDTCILDQGQRLYRKFVRIYNGNDEVYVRTRIADGGSKAGFYDIYILAIDPASITGITEHVDYKTISQKVIYNLNGIRQNGLKRGLNIIVKGDGSVEKVLVK